MKPRWMNQRRQPLVIILIRTALEDQTLQEELWGYREFSQRVRYRLMPGVY